MSSVLIRMMAYILMKEMNMFQDWMKKLGVAMKLSDIGATEDMIDGIADGTIILDGGYKVLSKDDVKAILRERL